MDSLTGSLERVTYYNPENGFSVIRLRPDRSRTPGADREGLVTAIGNLPELSPGEFLRLTGEWVTHPRHGPQFEIKICEQSMPATLVGIQRYLGSGLVKGIGPKLAERIVAHFQLDTLNVIENQPARLGEVSDIGPRRSNMIAAAWNEQKQVKDIMLFLHSYGITTSLAVKIYKQYGEHALEVVRSDPYRLAKEIWGVGFKSADRIAQALGLPPDHPSRIEAGLIYILNQQTNQGHVFYPEALLTDQACELLGVGPDLVTESIQRLVSEDRARLEHIPIKYVVSPRDQTSSGERPDLSNEYDLLQTEAPNRQQIQPSVYLTPLYVSEIGVADRLAALAQSWPTALSSLPPTFISIGGNLSAEQEAAVRAAISHPLCVLTGGPGTGKTTTVRAFIDVLESSGKRYALASPTGRAAKRLSEATGRPAVTIHRLLGYKPGSDFKFDASNPLLVDVLVVDEASMLDLILTNNLLKALAPGTHLLLVGDVDQLPSVGAGDVLRDIINGGVAQVIRLSTIFRQAAGSLIIQNSHRINHGQAPIIPSDALGGDFFLFPAEDAQKAADWVEDVVCNRIPKKFGFHPRDHIQVLSPMYRGPAGVDALNSRLQAVLNPPEAAKTEKSLFGQIFRVGDKVMVVQNNYDKEIFNGDIGYLFSIDVVNHTLTVDFDRRGVVFDWSEADQLVLAYAISVHKAQGSEFQAVVLPVVPQHYMMLQRNLIYTAITRASKLCVVVGSKRALSMAVKNNPVDQRYSALGWRLQQRH